MNKTTYLVTGGAGFIGSNFVKLLREREPAAGIVVLDALTYCGNLKSISAEVESGAVTFVKGDIADRDLVCALLDEHRPAYIINFAAETHVDGPMWRVHSICLIAVKPNARVRWLPERCLLC